MITRANFWFAFGGLWLGLGILFAVVGAFLLWQHTTTEERLARDGASASGVVMSKSRRGDPNKQPTYHIEYRYQSTDGTVIEQTTKVDRKTWNALAEGGPIAVHYVRDAPRLHRVQGESGERQILGWIFTPLGSLFAIAGALILWRAAAQRKLVEQLLREGARANAEVIGVAPMGLRLDRVDQWVVHYRYRDSIGRAHEGTSPPMAPEEAQRWKPGDRVEVAFERARPERSVWIAQE
jgi:hypothetical protein